MFVISCSPSPEHDHYTRGADSPARARRDTRSGECLLLLLYFVWQINQHNYNMHTWKTLNFIYFLYFRNSENAGYIIITNHNTTQQHNLRKSLEMCLLESKSSRNPNHCPRIECTNLDWNLLPLEKEFVCWVNIQTNSLDALNHS